MPLSAQEYQRFLAHMAQFGPQLCPVCNTQNWTVQEIVEAKEYSEDQDPIMRLQLSSVPLLLVVCQRCYYVRHFAWLAIAAEGGAGG